MKYATLCSGIEAPSVAWHGLGFEPVAFSEVAPFPSRVLAHRFPDVPNLGDMTAYDTWNLPHFDLLFGSCPCQSYSAIGNREGVSDPRGALTLSFVLAARKWNPRWVGFENVPGILSSRDNAFGQLLAGLCGEDSALPLPGSRWPDAGVVSGPERVVAWRVLDAQYFGSPQTRRRVFLLASRGPRNFASAAALFPVGEGLPGRPPARPRTYPHHRPHLPGSAGARGLVPSTGDLSHCLNAGGMGRIDLETESMVAEFRDGRPHGVRMLTPLECERIQGLPEGWTDVPGAPVPDSARYRAVGNAIAVPVLEWLGRRLQAVDSSFAF